MNDIEFALQADTQEKKRIARSAAKRSGRTKKCTLPFETLKGKERKAYMGNEVVSVFKMRPMSLSEFKNDVPEDKKAELLCWYGDRFGWSHHSVGLALNASHTTAARLLRQYKLDEVFMVRQEKTTVEEKREHRKNREELKAQRSEEAETTPIQEVSRETHIPTPVKKEKLSQEKITAIPEGFEISLRYDRRDASSLARQLANIAESLDLDEMYSVSLMIRSCFEPD